MNDRDCDDWTFDPATCRFCGTTHPAAHGDGCPPGELPRYRLKEPDQQPDELVICDICGSLRHQSRCNECGSEVWQQIVDVIHRRVDEDGPICGDREGW